MAYLSPDFDQFFQTEDQEPVPATTDDGVAASGPGFELRAVVQQATDAIDVSWDTPSTYVGEEPQDTAGLFGLVDFAEAQFAVEPENDVLQPDLQASAKSDAETAAALDAFLAECSKVIDGGSQPQSPQTETTKSAATSEAVTDTTATTPSPQPLLLQTSSPPASSTKPKLLTIALKDMPSPRETEHTASDELYDLGNTLHQNADEAPAPQLLHLTEEEKYFLATSDVFYSDIGDYDLSELAVASAPQTVESTSKAHLERQNRVRFQDTDTFREYHDPDAFPEFGETELGEHGSSSLYTEYQGSSRSSSKYDSDGYDPNEEPDLNPSFFGLHYGAQVPPSVAPFLSSVPRSMPNVSATTIQPNTIHLNPVEAPSVPAASIQPTLRINGVAAQKELALAIRKAAGSVGLGELTKIACNHFSKTRDQLGDAPGEPFVAKAKDKFRVAKTERVRRPKKDKRQFDYSHVKVDFHILMAPPLRNVARNPASNTYDYERKLETLLDQKDCIINRKRYLRHSLKPLHGMYENTFYERNPFFDPNHPYQQEYTRVELNPTTRQPIMETRSALCTYCEDISFYELKNSCYSQHMSHSHGIYTDDYLTPDPLLIGRYQVAKKDSPTRKTKPRIRCHEGVVCPACYDVVEVRCWSSTSQKKPLSNYLRHFKEHHRVDKRKETFFNLHA